MGADLSPLFAPKTVAVIGASDTAGTQPAAMWSKARTLLEPRGATVVPIHPTKTEIGGVTAYPSVLDVPGPVDLAIVLVRDPEEAVAACVEKGVRIAIVFAAGYRETGTAEGEARHDRLAALARTTRILGPNTNLNVLEDWRRDLPGKRIAIVTQSGYQGRPIAQAETLGIGIESWVTLGNEIDLEAADFIAEYARRDGTGAIAGYVEGLHDGRTFMAAAEEAARHRVPIVLIKIGRTDEGRVAAASHTAHVTGDDAVHDAVFEQLGVTRVDDIDELIEVAGMFCHVDGPLAAGRAGGVGIYAMSGGTAAHMADLCAAAGLSLPRLDPATVVALHEHIPTFLRVDNPVDTGGTIHGRPAGRATLELLLADPAVDVVIAPITGVYPGMSDALATDILAVREAGVTKPILVPWTSPIRDDTYRSLCDAGVPVFHSFGAAVRGAKALVDWSRALAEPASEGAPVRGTPRAVVRPGAFDEVESKALLRAYGIPVVDEHVATDEREAVDLARRLGPVAMKVLSPEILHKSDAGLVELGVTGDEGVIASYRRLLERAGDAKVEGVVVQPMVTDGVVEALLGLARQEPFGLTVVVGLGGVFVEVFRDVAFGVPPFGRRHAERMVASLRSRPLLQGARGRPRADEAALVDAVLALEQLAIDLDDELETVDVNPLIVRPAGAGVVAVDALVVGRSGRIS